MIYFLLVITAFFLVSMIWAAIDSILDNDNEQKKHDFDCCYNCQSGFCMYTPGDKDCEAWKNQNEKNE